jgi:Fic family protein
MLIMPKHEVWIRREVAVERAAATTRIEGARLDAGEVGELVKKARPRTKLSNDERANMNALEAYEFVDYLSDQPEIPLDELVIRELNRYFLRGDDELKTPGVYRQGQNKVGERYMPPNQGDLAALMRSFATWLSADDDLHPALKAGIAHIHLVAIHPFWDGNGRTARALATLILQRSQLHFKKLLSLERFYDAIRRDYISAFEQTLGDQFVPEYDATKWLEFFTTTLFAESMRLTGELTKWHQQMEATYKRLEKMDVSHRQADALAYAARTGRITRAEYIEITGASPLTASRELARLAKLGALDARGKTRARIYLYNLKATDHTDKSVEQATLFDVKGG